MRIGSGTWRRAASLAFALGVLGGAFGPGTAGAGQRFYMLIDENVCRICWDAGYYWCAKNGDLEVLGCYGRDEPINPAGDLMIAWQTVTSIVDAGGPPGGGEPAPPRFAGIIHPGECLPNPNGVPGRGCCPQNPDDTRLKRLLTAVFGPRGQSCSIFTEGGAIKVQAIGANLRGFGITSSLTPRLGPAIAHFVEGEAQNCLYGTCTFAAFRTAQQAQRAGLPARVLHLEAPHPEIPHAVSAIFEEGRWTIYSHGRAFGDATVDASGKLVIPQPVLRALADSTHTTIFFQGFEFADLVVYVRLMFEIGWWRFR